MQNLIKNLSGSRVLLFIASGYTIFLVGSSLLSLKDTPINEISVSDKILHGAAYFFLVVLWKTVFSKEENTKRKKQKQLAIIALGAFSLGTIIEVLQGVLTNYREPDVYDMLANAAGIILASILIAGRIEMSS